MEQLNLRLVSDAKYVSVTSRCGAYVVSYICQAKNSVRFVSTTTRLVAAGDDGCRSTPRDPSLSTVAMETRPGATAPANNGRQFLRAVSLRRQEAQ